MPAAKTILEISGCQVACSPISKNVALAQLSCNALITAGVFSGHGPSSNVSTTSWSRRKSYCLKCSLPKAGPPVVSIWTTRDSPMPSGLLQAGSDCAGVAAACGAAEGAGAAACGTGLAGLGGMLCWNRSGVTGALVWPLFWATRAGAAGSGRVGEGASDTVACATWVTGWPAGADGFACAVGDDGAAAGAVRDGKRLAREGTLPRWDMTIPKAARPNVNNAATKIATTRIGTLRNSSSSLLESKRNPMTSQRKRTAHLHSAVNHAH